MFKSTVNDGSEQLWFEQEVSEARAVDGNVGPLDLLLASGGHALGGYLRLLILLVVQQLVVNISFCHVFYTKTIKAAMKFHAGG